MNPPLVSVLARGDVQPQTLGDCEVIACSDRNQGMADAQGKFVGFLEAGDVWAPQKLEKQLNLLAQNPSTHWCLCNVALPVQPMNVLRDLFVHNFIPSSTVVVRRSVLQKLGGFNESLAGQLCQDWDLWLRIAAECPAVSVAEHLVDASPKKVEIEAMYTCRKQVVEAAVQRSRPQLQELRSKALAEVCFDAGCCYLAEHETSKARDKFAEALTHSPMHPGAYLSWASSFFPAEVQQQIRDLHNLSRMGYRPLPPQTGPGSERVPSRLFRE